MDEFHRLIERQSVRNSYLDSLERFYVYNHASSSIAAFKQNRAYTIDLNCHSIYHWPAPINYTTLQVSPIGIITGILASAAGEVIAIFGDFQSGYRVRRPEWHDHSATN
jgi:hypothetical protein